jgi:hypothetical protein
MSASVGARRDLQRLVAWLGDLRVLVVGLLMVVLALILVTAFSGTAESAIAAVAPATLGGDDAYDPAAGSVLARLSRPAGLARAAGYSGDDLYDPAAGARPALGFGGAPRSFSGDDLYDPAAGSRPAWFSRPPSAGYSGDDAYDPAAGGLTP